MNVEPADPRSDQAPRLLGAPALYGLALTLVLLSTLLYVLWRDHREKIQNAERQVAALAMGSDRLLTLEMRSIESALQGVAVDSRILFENLPTASMPVLQESIAGVSRRHPELIDIVIVDGSGHALSAGTGDPGIASWARRAENRLGGNEFLIVLVEDIGRPAIDALVGRILAALAEPIEALSTLHYLSLNAGIARYPEHGRAPDLLFKNAGLATHEAKRRGHNQLVEFTPEFERVVIDRQKLASRLHEAMERNEFELFFQPLFDTSWRRPVGLEALIRWRHPERGLVPPVEFIPVCEDSGLIVPLGRWVLREACRYHLLLAEAGWAHLTIAVNVSALQFLSGELENDSYLLARPAAFADIVVGLEAAPGR